MTTNYYNHKDVFLRLSKEAKVGSGNGPTCKKYFDRTKWKRGEKIPSKSYLSISAVYA